MSEKLHRPEIDGLRGLAVLAVAFYHADWFVSGGFVGVDVFFVLSGYLITSLLRKSLQEETFSLLHFWQRRIRRIFPALFVLLATTLCAGYFLLPPPAMKRLGESAAAQSLFLANFYFWHDAGYFAEPAKLQPLLHTWSLSVEEQFYLLFPLLVWFLYRRDRPWRLFWGLLLLAFVSLAFSIYQTAAHPSAAFFLLPSRMWELLAGAVLAAIPGYLRSRPRLDFAISLVGLIAILTPIFVYTPQTPFPGITSLPPVLGTTAILYATTATKDSFCARVLSLPPLAFVGLISYSLYLWHWPMLAFCRIYGWTPPLHTAAAIAASMILSVISWRWIEAPFRFGLKSLTAKSIITSGLLCSAALLGSALLATLADDAANRYPPEWRLAAEDVGYTGLEYMTPAKQAFDPSHAPTIGLPPHRSERPDLVLWGDSHGMALAALIDELAKEEGLHGVARLESGTCPLPNAWRPNRRDDEDGRLQRAGNAAFLDYLRKVRPTNLLLVARWSFYCEGFSQVELEADPHLPSFEIPLVDRDDAPRNLTESRTVLGRQLRELAELCRTLEIRLWILKEVPETGEAFCARDFLFWKLGRRSHPPDRRLTLDEYRKRQASVAPLLEDIEGPDVILLDPAPALFDSDGRTINYNDQRAFYRDSDHLTRRGAQELRPLLQEALRSMREGAEK